MLNRKRATDRRLIKKILHVHPRRHAEIGGESLVYLLPSGKLGVFQYHAYSEHSQRAPHQVGKFLLAYT